MPERTPACSAEGSGSSAEERGFKGRDGAEVKLAGQEGTAEEEGSRRQKSYKDRPTQIPRLCEK